ncbi:MAG: 50S ribosomal protein L6 [Gammaproteobacteria bacterium]|nr:50S ribosomal protein L6 [Gammaproteobacteria bacterium]
MSRIAKKPIAVPGDVKIEISGQDVQVKGPKGTLNYTIHTLVSVSLIDGTINVTPCDESQNGDAQAGTTRALLSNMIVGVSTGYMRKLDITGVGYRAAAKGNVVSLSLGYSHPIEFNVPTGITVETPTQTEILIKGIDKQQVGQVAANIRAYRRPEPYKGKGVRYANEQIRRKEAKKT